MADGKDEPVRMDKAATAAFVASMAPEYLDVLDACRDAARWRKVVDQFDTIVKRFNIENYVLLYEDQRRIVNALMKAMMTDEGQRQFGAELGSATPEERDQVFRELAAPGGVADQIASELIPDDPQVEAEQLRRFEALSDPDKRDTVTRGQFFWGFNVAWIHEVLAVMIHGERMTSLVPKALAGDQSAYLKAIHIDKTLRRRHAGLGEIEAQAIRNGDRRFLEAVGRWLASPVARGRIQYPGVFFIFALLESLEWLDDMRHREILDICDAAGLDRWQNRIEDENAITKALLKYRRNQKTGGVSMH
jgi:ribosomal protein S18 acetylase RimI-like enzyme